MLDMNTKGYAILVRRIHCDLLVFSVDVIDSKTCASSSSFIVWYRPSFDQLLASPGLSDLAPRPSFPPLTSWISWKPVLLSAGA
jgi:hypothetical protein